MSEQKEEQLDAEVAEAKEAVNMTEVMEEYLMPLLAGASDEGMIRNAFALGVMCWNASLVPDDMRAQVIGDALGPMTKTLDIMTLNDMHGLMQNLIERKLELFGEIRAFISNYRLDFQEDGQYYLEVEHMETDFEKMRLVAQKIAAAQEEES